MKVIRIGVTLMHGTFNAERDRVVQEAEGRNETKYLVYMVDEIVYILDKDPEGLIV